jgi:hypothetical protein
MANENAGSWDRRIADVRNAGDKALRRIVMRQSEAVARYGTELSKFAAGKRGAQVLAGSLMQLAADEGARYAEEVYRAGVDYYKALVAFYRVPLSTEGEPHAPVRTAKRGQRTRARARTRTHTRASA